MISAEQLRSVVARLGPQAVEDIAWSESIKPPTDADDFASEAIFVICNSGMKNTIARRIFERVMNAIMCGHSAGTAFGHAGKAKAIDDIWQRRSELLSSYLAAPDKVAFCESLPWIGGITKYHLAKNFGADVAKPDVHLQRLADREGTSAQGLCARLAAETGYRIATVDLILWRACAVGLVSSRTGAGL
ncbi:MAG: hypothetical protein E5V28_07775 [Mesorhizobium sp.]|nr:MAG: hypothetical protein E5V28_07775 [Mesorhizobium sp.]